MVTILMMLIAAKGNTQVLNSTEQPYIEVTGTAEKEVIPDEIYIGIIIHEKYSNKIKVTIEEQEEKLKTAIKSLGINLQNLYLTDINADYVKIQRKKSDVLTQKNYSLKVSDAVTVGKVFQELDKLEITDANISKVTHSRLDSIKREVRIVAIKAAKEKADYLLEAIGEHTGKPLVVRDSDPAYYSNASNVYVRSSYSYGSATDGVKYKSEEDIQFQKIKILSSTYVKFSIK